MPMTAYTGLPGHGKSYGVVENVIVPLLKEKRTVFTNIPMNSEKCLERFQCEVVQFKTQDVIDNPNWFDEVFEKGATLVFDEVWRLWPSGLKANNALESHKQFLAEHRHMVSDDGFSTEIVIVTQDLSQVAAFPKALIDTTYRVTKLSKVGRDKSYRVDVYTGAVAGTSPPARLREREIFGTRKQEIYDLYESATMSKVGVGNEKRTDNRFNLLSGSKVKLIILGFIFAFVAAIYLFSKFYNESQFIDHGDDPQIQKINRLKSELNEKPKPLSKEVQQPVEVKKEQTADFVNEASKIYMTGLIKSADKTIVTLKIVFPESTTFISQDDLIKVGYNVEVITPCLSKITGFKRIHFALCQSSKIQTDLIPDL